ncbi:hypothetical protein F5Y11DRAFT_185583 [Daldinia sp. FL1419]|nr:hypothetical protein F5Y11DRAFT_185583 [Daldinia sp. FL1419]
MARMGLNNRFSGLPSLSALSGLTNHHLARLNSVDSTPVRVLLALAPVAIPTAYFLYLQRSLARHTAASALISPPDPLTASSTSSVEKDVLPSSVREDPEAYIVAKERITSSAVPISSIRPDFVTKRGNLDGLLEAYLSATMTAFSWTPQALVMARMGSGVADPEAYRRTFSAEYLAACRFRPGDRVCGVYVVRTRSRSKGRVVLDVSPPEGWKGPVVGGALVVGFDVERAGRGKGRSGRRGRGDSGADGEGADEIRFVNETVMWREKEGGKATLLEGRLGRWLHTFMARWLVVKGVAAVTGEKRESE